MPIIPERDPNEAYEVIPMPYHPRGPHDGWWTAICNGIPVHHFAPEHRHLADRYATDPEYRLSLIKPKVWENGRT